jgi:hypothetical protein
VRSEAAYVRRLAPVLSVVLAMGCTTRVINLAAADGGAETPSVVREDASVDREDAGVAPKDVSVTPVDVKVAPEDAVVDLVAADSANSANLKEALDAGMVPGPSYFVVFTCCFPADGEVNAGTCTSLWLGGAETCYSAAQWKDRASSQCTSMAGAILTDYRLVGAC